MADNLEDPTEEYEAPETATLEPSPDPVTDVGEPPVETRPSYEEIDEKYRASSTEARRQKERADQAEYQMAQQQAKMGQFQNYLQQQQMVQNMAAQQQHMQTQFPPGGLNEEETSALTEAYQSGDNEKIQQLETVKEQRLGQKIQLGILSQLGTEAARANRATQSIQFLSAQPELGDTNSPVYRKAAEIYNFKLSNPQAQIFEAAVGNLPDGTPVNPHIFKEAFLEAKAYASQTPSQEAVQQSVQGDYHSEGGGGGRKQRQPVNPVTGGASQTTKPGKSETEVQLQKLLPKSIREYVDAKRRKYDETYTLKKWFAGLTSEERDEYRRRQ